MTSFTRRDFLKLSAAGLLSLLLAELRLDKVQAAAPPLSPQGRVTWHRLDIYDEPSFSGKILNTYGRDRVLPITGEVTGGEESDYNRTWYHIGEEGYAYSGWLQPVQTSYNLPVYDIPETGAGALAEVTIPLIETRRGAGYVYRRTSLRLYHGTTHWVKGIFRLDDDTTWYSIYDRLTDDTYYVPTYALRIIPDEELAPLSPEVPNELKSIYVDLASQTMVAFEDDKPVLTTRIASGTKGSRTPTGDFLTYHKGPSIHMTDGAGDDANYDLPGVPWVSFFTGTGMAFHGTYWHNDFGHPRSHGCVNLSNAAAKFIYLWSMPVVPPGTDYLHLPGEGTRVKIVDPKS